MVTFYQLGLKARCSGGVFDWVFSIAIAIDINIDIVIVIAIDIDITINIVIDINIVIVCNDILTTFIDSLILLHLFDPVFPKPLVG